MRQSSSGEQYRVLDPSGDVQFDVVDYAKHDNLGAVGGFDTHHIYVTCEELKNKCLPIDANPREPSKSTIVKSMQDTLKDNPESFVKWNNGITVVCEQVNKNNATVELEFAGEDEGICNGGHTYFAIVTTDYDISDAAVKLEVIQIPPGFDNRDDEIVEIAKKRNNINNLDNYTVADFLGLYDPFKRKLEDPTIVSWHENDSEAKPHAVTAPDFIRMLTAINPERYRHAILSPEKGYHKSAATSKSKLHTDWFEDALEARDSGEDDPMKHLGVLADDLFEIADMLAYSFEDDNYDSSFRKKSFYQDNIGGDDGTYRDLHHGEYEGLRGWKFPSTLQVMILGMFRSNIYLKYDSDQNEKYIGWMVEPKQLWQEEKERIVEDLSTFYDDVGKSYRDFINSEAPYREELFEFGRKPDWPNPPAEVLYDCGTGEKFEHTTDEEVATHWLAESEEGLVDISDEGRPGTEPLYAQID